MRIISVPTRARGRFAALLLALGWLLGSCFDQSTRWDVPPPTPAEPLCKVGEERCATGVERCEKTDAGVGWVTIDDCAAQGLTCVTSLLACKTCAPNTSVCQGQTVMQCDASGNHLKAETTCTGAGVACRGGICQNLCALAAAQRSNVGCEYWGVDLDNAVISDSLNAAAQQYAIVVSNPQPDLTANVKVEQDDSAPGTPNAPVTVAIAAVPPLSLRVFKLGPREVDGSPPGQFNTGTNTALTRHAYRVTSDAPIVAYQFNPLDNVNVFSNDAALLKPVEALTLSPGVMTDSYVALGWPQTIAITDDPNTNFDPSDPINLRVFLTVVGTRPNTHVKVKTNAAVVAGGPVHATPIGGEIDAELNPFDVLNLETGSFNADFTGSVVSADQPVVVFSGSEASDAPYFTTLSARQCCADHLEAQLDPIRTAGKNFVASMASNRTRAVAAAGASIGVVQQPEFFRVIAATNAGATVKTTLGGKLATIHLATRGSFQTITTTRDFMLTSDQPVMLGDVLPSQDAAGVPRGLPGGDPTFIIVPPVEQYRTNYVFLTPDKYSFDFVRAIAPPDADVVLDGQDVKKDPDCKASPADGLTAAQRGSPTPPFVVYMCQLSFPVIDPSKPSPDNVTPGRQNDGVHSIDSNDKVGVIVDGFDSYVSYGYAAGTELTEIVPK
jgi:IgGFc binding protein